MTFIYQSSLIFNTAAVNSSRSFFRRLFTEVSFYIKTNSYLFVIKLVDVTFLIVSAVILSILDVLSFDALDSVADSAAAE
jgi:hypothetical protein